MSLKQLALGCAVFGLMLASGTEAFSQGTARRDDFEIKDIRQQPVSAPTYGGAGVLGGRPATLWQKWLKIEVTFESKPEWADDVQIKYYVLLNDRGTDKLFVGEITHNNIAKGSQHYSAMFMHPNSLMRYGGGQAVVVTAWVFYKGVVVSERTEAQGKTTPASWWERYTPIAGCLLPPQETPWAPVASERFESVKPTTR